MGNITTERLKLIFYTRQFRKEHLILVNSFGTNSHILKPAIEYFNDYCTVHFIDLPGFIKEEAPLHLISIEGYVEFVNKKIAELNLESYILGGISFGFFIANKVTVDSRCKALFAMEPYLGVDSLRLDTMHKVIYLDLLRLITASHLVKPVWKNKYFPKLLEVVTSYSPKQILDAWENLDAKTFLDTAKLLLTDNERIIFQDKPYILGINRNDETIVADYVIEEFKRNTKKLFIMYTHIAHYPKHLTVNYMKRKVNEKDMYAMIRWVNHQCKVSTYC